LRTWIIAAVALLVGALLVYAAWLNTETVPKVDWVFGEAQQVPLWRALAASALLGGLLSFLVCSIPALRLKLRLRRAERRIAGLEREVHGLRTLPLEEEIRDVSREG
jgi:uncharacterized integral membrane protein